ncbi:MAG TPA: flagellar biosynthesis protein FlhF, partial [Spirochaetia bacterium]|nr:flagellar biosynthesis protein FlhF [Spirochaetia bacterium]
MQYNTIQANSYLEAIEKMKNQYGPSARPMTCRNIRYGGFLGLFKTEGVEVTCYLAADSKAGGISSVETEKKKILESLSKNQTMQIILKEIQALKKDLSVSRSKEEPLHGSIMRIRDLLELNDFSRDFIDQITVKLRQEFSLETLEDFDAVKERVIEWIGEGIKIYSPKDSAEGKPRIITIIGPTGVGKTTTVAKLAAIYGLERGSSSGLQVRMVTIDNYKIA